MSLYKSAISIVRRNKTVFSNLSYMTIFQVFMLIAPLITYPYLVKTIGMDLYGIVLTAQMLVSYATLFVDFGSSQVCAKHVSVNRDNPEKLSEIVNSILCVRSMLFVFCFLIYFSVVLLVPIYKEHRLLFLLTYLFVLNDVLYPQYFFQGVERIKMITVINIITKLIFIIFVFVVVRSADDYIYVPLLYATGYMLGGSIALYVIYVKMGIKFYIPSFKVMKFYIKDAMPLFATDLVCVIKDKFNYLFVGPFLGMDSVVIYDLALKLNAIISKPLNIINTVMFPRIAKDRKISVFKKVTLYSTLLVVVIVLFANIFLPWIVNFFIHKEVDLLPIRLMMLAPIILAVSVNICALFFVAFGYNKYVLKSIIITTSSYLILAGMLYITGCLSSIYAFVCMALIPYLVEFIYRIVISRRIINRDKLS